MTTEVGAYEAKTHLARLLERVEAGETIIVTKHGRPVARLAPVHRRPSGPDVVDALRRARIGVRRGADTVADMIADGRR